MTTPTSPSRGSGTDARPCFLRRHCHFFGLDGLCLLGSAASSRPRRTAVERAPLILALSPSLSIAATRLDLRRDRITLLLIERATRRFRAHFTGAGIFSCRASSITSQRYSPESGWLTTPRRRTTDATLALSRSFGSLAMQPLRRSSFPLRSSSCRPSRPQRRPSPDLDM